MYLGQVNLAQEDLDSFLAVAEELEVKGLTPGEHLSNCDPGEIIWQIAGECLQHPPWLLGNIYTGLDPKEAHEDPHREATVPLPL